MEPVSIEFDHLTHLTVGAIGEPGHRVFYLQAGDESRIMALKLEKDHVAALARSIDAMVEELEQEEVLRPVDDEVAEPATTLDEPDEWDFVVGQMGLAFDRETLRMVLMVQELPLSDDTPPTHVRFWSTVAQMVSLSREAKALVARGRPICSLCGRPIEPDGHFCPGGNGHSDKIQEN